MELSERVVVITGAARGIGQAIARAVAAQGPTALALVDLPSSELDAAASEVGELARAYPADLGDAEAVAHLVRRIEDDLGPIDLFVSNAGIGSGAGVDATAEQWDQIWRVNVLAHVHVARALLPSVVAQGEAGRSGPGGGRRYLLITASAAGLLSQIGDLPYSVTKHAAVAVAEWLAITYGDQGLTVSCLCPQGVRTDMLAHAMGHTSVQTVMSQGLMEPSEVADAVIEGVRRERFLILPHPEVATYYQRRATDPDRWLAGMRRLQARILGEPGLDPPQP